MQQQPPRGSSSQSAAAFAFDAKIENEEPLVDAMLASMIRSALPPEAWDRLHGAAQRDDRLSEVAFAFESVSQGKRLRASQPGVAAEFLFQAARFIGDVFGDTMGATTYLERALALSPGHAAAFAGLETLLQKAQQPKRLAELYASAAQHRPRAEQIALVRRAAALYEEAGGADDRVAELLQGVLRLDPGDEDARSRLEALYVRANRFRDVVRLNEQALTADPGPSGAARAALLARVVEIYADRLQEPERALPHIEQLLAIDPSNERARRVAQKLVVTKGLAGRAAAALAAACEVAGSPQEVVRFLTIEFENTRGAKRAAILLRLAEVRSERLNDDAGAFDALEQALTLDPVDDVLRARYVAVATRLQRYADAAKSLARVGLTAKEPAVKARANAQLGLMQLRGGDAKRAKGTLSAVLATPDLPSDAALTAAYALSEILETEKDPRPLCDALEQIARLETDPEKRRDADRHVAELATRLRDAPRAIAAYERLLDTDVRALALEALAPLYEAAGSPEKLAQALELRAADTADDSAARALLMRAAAVRVQETKDPAAALATCRGIVARFGPARDVLALAVPLLDGQRLWTELTAALAHDAALASGREQGEILARLGATRLSKLRDVAGALDAFQEALAFDPQERTARAALERLTAAGDHRLEAAAVLEPIYRREGALGPLLKLLELRGSLEADVDGRLAALREAIAVARDHGDGEQGRTLDLLGRGLAEAVSGDRPLAEWIDAIDALDAATDAKRRTAIFCQAIGDREVTSADLVALAMRAAENSAAVGDAQGALDLYRRALAFDPQSPDLLARVDDLLRDQGSPRERIALYRAALARGSPERRRELIHRIGTVQWRDLGDLEAAITTYRAALEGDAEDTEAAAALETLFAKAEQWDNLYTLLEERLARAGGDTARSLRAKIARLAAERGDRERARTQCARLLEDPELRAEHLDVVGVVADMVGDDDVARAVLVRHAEPTTDPREPNEWIERLGVVDHERRADLAGAAAAWRRAASIAEAASDDETARRLYAMVLGVAPRDTETLHRLVTLHERAELWGDLPRLYGALSDVSSDAAERTDLADRRAQVLFDRLGDPEGGALWAGEALALAPTRPDLLATFERLSFAAGATSRFERKLDAILADGAAPPLEGEPRGQMLLVRARAIAADPTRADDAAAAFRAILEDEGLGAGARNNAFEAFDAFLSREGAPSLADRRWLLEWSAEHAGDAERVPRLLEWARAEETTFGDPARALLLYRRALATDAQCDEALTAAGRLALTTGDIDEAIASLRARRERADGPGRVAIDLEIARVLLARTTRWEDALATLRGVLDDAPADPAALGLAVQLLSQRATRAETVTLFEHAYEAAEDADARVEILTRLVDAPADAEDVDARRVWFERLCDLYRDRGQTGAALAIAVRAARALPGVPALWDRAEELARTLSSPNEVAVLYEEVLARALPHEQAMAIGERAVRFNEEWFEDTARVVTILERVLELDASADWAFDRLKLVLDAAERWDELFALYDRALESTEGPKRAALLEDAAQTAKDFAGRPDRAIQYLEQLRELKPNDAKLAGSLERLYERQGRHRELVSLLTARLPSFKADEALRTRMRVAQLQLDELGDSSGALETVEPLLERSDEKRANEKSAGATRGDAELWALLERVLAASPPSPESRRASIPPLRGDEAPRSRRPRHSEPPPSARGSVRQRAAAWLRGHYAATGQDADLARMLLIELEMVKAATERVRRHVEIAALYEKLGDPASALEQVGLSVILAPDDPQRRAKLDELAERTSRFDRLAEVLAAAAGDLEWNGLRTALTMQAAAVRADRVGDPAGASALLAAILAADGPTRADVLAAARRLDPLLETTGRADERLDVVERIALVESDEAARREALGRAARLATQLGDEPRGIGLWETCVRADAHDVEALDGLVDLLERTGRSDRLVEVLELRAAASVSARPERRRSDRVRVARLLNDVLGRRDEAIEAWNQIEQEFGEADDAAVALSAILREAQRWPELAALLRRRASGAQEATGRAELLQQLGDVQRGELAAPDAALQTYAEALAADPRNAAARAGLHALGAGADLRPVAVGVLLGAMRACDDWPAILELTAHRMAVAATDGERLEVLLEAADISERRAGDPELAFEAVRRAFAIAPGDAKVAGEMERLAGVADAWPRLVASYRDAIDGPLREDAALSRAIWRRIGEALEIHANDGPGALDAYLKVLATVAEVDVGCAAVRIAGSLGDWSTAARVLVQLAGASGVVHAGALALLEDAAARAAAWGAMARAITSAAVSAHLEGTAARDLHTRLGEIHRDRSGDAGDAEASFRLALEQDPDDAALLSELARLQRLAGGRPFVDTLTRLSRATGGDIVILREAAEVASGAGGDHAEARSIAEELFQVARQRWLEPPAEGSTDEDRAKARASAEWAIELLARLHGEAGDDRAVLAVLVMGDGLPFELPVRREMRRRAARIALDRTSETERGVALYLSLLDDDPKDAEAIDRLASTYAASGRTRELLALRQRQVAAADDVVERLGLRLQAAGLLTALREPGRAVETLRDSLLDSPRHEPTVESLVVLLEAPEKAQELRDLLVDQGERAEAAGDPGRAAQLWWRAAAIAEERLGTPAAAAAYHARVVALEPRAASFDALARLAAARGDHAAAADWLERLIGVVGPEGRTGAASRLASALVAAGQSERAADRLEELLQADPVADALREQLAALYRERGAWAKLARLIAGAALHASDKATRMARLLEAAELFSGRCAEPESSIPLLEQASDLAPADAQVRLRLAEALASARRFDDARGLLQSMIDGFGGRRPRERAPVHHQMARLELAIGNRARALVELDTATRVDPQDAETLRALAQLAQEDGQLERAEKTYRALLAVLRRRDEARGAPTIARSEVLLELSAIAESHGEGDRAKEILESAFEAATQSEFEQERLEAALRARGSDEMLARVLEGRVARTTDPRAAARALAELATVFEARLARPEQAFVARLRALALDPGSEAAHDAARKGARTLGEMGRYVDGAFALVEPAIESGDTALACALLLRLGAVAEDDLRDDARAAALYERAIDLGIRSTALLGSLDRVYGRLGDTDRQARILGLSVDASALEGGSLAASDAVYRLATLRLASRGTLDEGAALLERALDLQPELPRAADALRKAVAIDPENVRLIDLYERVARTAGDERALAEALRSRARLPGADIDALRAAVEACTRIGEGAAAEALLARFVENEPSSASEASLSWALGVLADLRAAGGDLAAAVDLKRRAARLAEPDVARRLTIEVARLARDELGNLPLAAEMYESLWETDRADREAWEPLAQIRRQLGESQKLAELLDRVIAYVDDGHERAQLRLERVRVARAHLGLDDAGAEALLRETLDEDPSQIDAALMLAGILEQRGSHEDLASLLASQIDAGKDRGDVPAIASLSLRLGALLETSDRVRARGVYYAGLEWATSDVGLLDALVAVLDGEEDAGERLDVLERRLAVESGASAEARALSLAAARAELGDEAGAERALELGYRAHPVSEALRGRLEVAYRQRGEWQKLAEIYMVDARARTDADARAGRFREAAVLWRTELNDARSAAAALRMARDARPHDLTLLEEHVSALVAAGDAEGANHELGEAIDGLAEDDVARAPLLAARARAHQAAGDDGAALEDLEVAFALDRKEHAPALEACLERSLQTALDGGDGDAVRIHRLRLAHVLPYTGDVDRARTLLGDLIKQDPRDREALDTLASLEVALERWDAASAALRRLVVIEEGDGLAEVALRLADACERAGRLGDARAALERARAVTPDDPQVRQYLERIYEGTGAWRELCELALEDARKSGDVAERFFLLTRAGSLLLERAGDPEGAAVALREACALRPKDPDCTGLLADALTVAGRPHEALAAIEPLLAPSKGRRVRELAGLHVRVARASGALGDADGELRALVLALECDSQSGRVCADVASRAMELGQVDLASRALRAITLMKSPTPMGKGLAYQRLGEIAHAQGDAKRAVTLLKRALAEDPTLDRAKALVERLE